MYVKTFRFVPRSHQREQRISLSRTHWSDPPPSPDASTPQKDREGDAVAEGGSNPPPVVDNRTAAEKRYDEQAAKTQEKLIQSMASKSHRDKVKDFNEYLSKLSEHHDIPKVGPG